MLTHFLNQVAKDCLLGWLIMGGHLPEAVSVSLKEIIEEFPVADVRQQDDQALVRFKGLKQMRLAVNLSYPSMQCPGPAQPDGGRFKQGLARGKQTFLHQPPTVSRWHVGEAEISVDAGHLGGAGIQHQVEPPQQPALPLQQRSRQQGQQFQCRVKQCFHQQLFSTNPLRHL